MKRGFKGMTPIFTDFYTPLKFKCTMEQNELLHQELTTGIL
jgi:hypothetical protein